MSAKIEESANGISITHDYFWAGLTVALMGGTLLASALTDQPVRPEIALLGAVLFCLGLLPLGTAQTLCLDKIRGELYYESTIAFFGGYKKSHKIDNIDEIHYLVIITKHYDRGRTWETAEGTVSLYLGAANKVTLLTVTHTDNFLDGLKRIADELGVSLERTTTHEEKRHGIRG